MARNIVVWEQKGVCVVEGRKGYVFTGKIIR